MKEALYDSGCAGVGNCVVVQPKHLVSRIPVSLVGTSMPLTALFHLLSPQLLEAWNVQEDICYTV